MIVIVLWLTRFSLVTPFVLHNAPLLWTWTLPIVCVLIGRPQICQSAIYAFSQTRISTRYILLLVIYLTLGMYFFSMLRSSPRLVWFSIFLFSHEATIIHWFKCASFPCEYQLSMLRNLPTPDMGIFGISSFMHLCLLFQSSLSSWFN